MSGRVRVRTVSGPWPWGAMTGRQPPADEQLFAALGELRQATVAVSYATLVRQAAAQQSALRISGKRLSDWFLGKAVPADPAVVRFLVEYLQPRATRTSGYRQRPLSWWLDLHQHAVRQREAKREDGGRSALLSGSHRLPRVWRVPTRNASFVGREEALNNLLRTLQTGLTPSIAVLHGIGGVGKTSLAVEYAHRHAKPFDVVWWIDAEDPASATEQFAALAVELGLTSEDNMARRGAAEARNWLQRHVGWLVILDDVLSPDLARELIPSGPGRILITSRDTRWSTIGAVIDVDVFSREESVSLLKNQNLAMSDADADLVAAAVDDLPLAVAQAAGFISETGMPAGEYVDELEMHANDLLNEGRPATYPRSAASVVALSVERLTGMDQAALGLLHLCAFLGPDPVPLSWLADAESMRPVQLRVAVGRLIRMGLARRTPVGDALVVHRTTAAIVRDILSTSERRELRTRLRATLVSVRPGEPDVVPAWPAWALLVLHVAFLQNVSPAREEVESPEFRALVLSAARYLELAGHARAANEMVARARERWSAALGDDHRDTMRAALRQAATLPPAHPDALRIEEELYARKVRLLGPDDPDTLATASNLAIALADLGRHDDARRLDEDTLARRHRVFGPDDSRTLNTMDSLANRLSKLGDPHGAKDLRDSVVATRRRVLGGDHPDVLWSRIGLARDLAGLGRLDEAAETGEATLADATRVLGTDHRLTLIAADTLAGILRARGDTTRARSLGEDLLARRLATLGPDHPETVASAVHLATDLAVLGEPAAAEALRRQFAIEPPG